jgi:hypothetical protein
MLDMTGVAAALLHTHNRNYQHSMYSLIVNHHLSPAFSTGKDRSAFTDKGAGRLALPRLLRLKPEDKLATGSKPLKNGRFTWVTEAGSQERWIVASCGRHTVIWNFRRCAALRGDISWCCWCCCGMLAAAGQHYEVLACMFARCHAGSQQPFLHHCLCLMTLPPAPHLCLIATIMNHHVQGEVCCVQLHLVWRAAHCDGLRAQC